MPIQKQMSAPVTSLPQKQYGTVIRYSACMDLSKLLAIKACEKGYLSLLRNAGDRPERFGPGFSPRATAPSVNRTGILEPCDQGFKAEAHCNGLPTLTPTTRLLAFLTSSLRCSSLF